MSSPKPPLERGSLSAHPEKFRRIHHPPKGSVAVQRIKALTGGPLTKSLMRQTEQHQSQHSISPHTDDEEYASDLLDALESGHQDFIAGVIGGMAGIAVGQPVDTLKVRVQTDPTYSTNVIKSFRKIVAQEGFSGLYKGMLSPLLGVGAINAIVFGVYGNSLKIMQAMEGLDLEDDAPLHMVFTGGCLGGFANCIIVSPVELVKTQLQVQEGKDKSKRRYKSMRDCYRQIYRSGGMPALYRGIVPTMWREIPSYGIYFASFEVLRRMWGDSQLSIFMAGGMGGVFAWVASYPFDVVKTRMQATPPKPHPGW
eukprot:CAMPEP_0117437776 /NCGR_PEP_ID=MMETSP0759-20121206/1706_1 /TAXON_ID=63605 /ORGANISM="Percolomonas cosmopolitus, Strain WS" /LENGTH=310 /DNA_ID=CAMNT_0005229435 /DNA_START=111 /DNA_END=1040 /DNA_ORIENTATION=+